MRSPTVPAVFTGPADSRPSGDLRRIALTAFAPLAWGTTYIVATELLPPGHPLFAGLLRALPAGLIALAVTRTLPRGAWWAKAAVLGVLNIGLLFPLLFVAAARVAVLAVAVLRESPSAWRIGWGLVGLTGVGLVVIGPAAAFDGIGLLAGLGAAATMALGLTLTKRWGRPVWVSPTGFAGWQLTAGGLFLLPLTALFEGAPPSIDAAAVLGYLWLGLFGGLIAYVVWFQGVTTLPVNSVAILALFSPLVAAALGAAVLGQTLGPVQLAGFGLSLAAIFAGQLPTPARFQGSSFVSAPREVPL